MIFTQTIYRCVSVSHGSKRLQKKQRPPATNFVKQESSHVILFLIVCDLPPRHLHEFDIKACYRSVSGLTGTGSSRWTTSPARTDMTVEMSSQCQSHCWLSFLDSLTIVYCHIKKLSTDNSPETLTQTLSNLESRVSQQLWTWIVWQIDTAEFTEMESYSQNSGWVMWRSPLPKGILGDPHLTHMITSSVPSSRDLLMS
jgi:hypothetical protein